MRALRFLDNRGGDRRTASTTYEALLINEHSDEWLSRRIWLISLFGLVCTSLVSVLAVFPMVEVDIAMWGAPWYVRYPVVLMVTAAALGVELIILFCISLLCVHWVSHTLQIRDLPTSVEEGHIFDVDRILARAALEIDDPPLVLLGIDPFTQISKWNLLVLGLLYKLKIVITNVVLKLLLSLLFGGGPLMGPIPIAVVAYPVEIFWNCIVIYKTILEARLRLVGHVLAWRLAHEVFGPRLGRFSPLVRSQCLRAIGNIVVFSRQYHPNNLLLLIRFQEELHIDTAERYDDWNLFLQLLQQVSEEERLFLLNLLTIAAAFDGKISDLETTHLHEAYGDDCGRFEKKLKALTQCMREGKIAAALALIEAP